MAMEGDIKYWGLPNIVQFICLGRQKAGLQIRRQQEEGTIYFANGEVVHAAVGPLQGEEAVIQMLSWTDGTFRISNELTAPDRTVGVNWNYLLLQGLKQFERAGDYVDFDFLQEESQPDFEKQDADHSIKLDFLLSRLEELASPLSRKKIQKHPLVALENLSVVLNELVETALHFNSPPAKVETLQSAHEKAIQFYSQAHMLLIQESGISIERVVNQYKEWRGSYVKRKISFRQVSRAMIYIMEFYFSNLTTIMHSKSRQEDWNEKYEGFVIRLTRSAEKINF
jgi:Domain of unknown function (DUF4388)